MIAAIASTEIVEGVLTWLDQVGKSCYSVVFQVIYPKFDPNLIHYKQITLLGVQVSTSGQFRQAANLICAKRLILSS